MHPFQTVQEVHTRSSDAATSHSLHCRLPPAVFPVCCVVCREPCSAAGLYPRALSTVSAALSHTPTNVDAYMLQARILKHAGDPLGAFAAMDACRSLDTADRYLNTKCVRYALRAGKEKEAEELVGLFLRDDADGLRALNELQVMWWEFHLGLACERRGDVARALKSFNFTYKHFTDIYEDQFDFHTYSVRKGVLRAYLDMLRWEDTLQAHKFFVRACTAIVRCYIALYDRAHERETAQLNSEQTAALTDDEKKALIKRQKKAAGKERKKQLAAEEEKKAIGNISKRTHAHSSLNRSTSRSLPTTHNPTTARPMRKQHSHDSAM